MKYILPVLALLLIAFGVFINSESQDSRISFGLFDYFPIINLIIKDKGDYKKAITQYKMTKYPYLNTDSSQVNINQKNSLNENPQQLKENIENFENAGKIQKN